MRSMTGSVRIDKWLWAARFFKTRAAATEAVLGGRVRVNGERVKPAKHVHAADIVEVRVGEVDWTITVLEAADKRGSARVAAADAMTELVRCAGTQFDPEVVGALAAELGVELQAVGAA